MSSNTRRRSHSVLEALESRTLMHAGHDHAFMAAINFQPATATVPAGYLADVGKTYRLQSSGLTYGWSTDTTSKARDRNSSRSPDQRYDTLNHLGGSSWWAIEVPSGSYNVRLIAGDPGYYDSVFKINVEGVLAINGTPTSGNRWLEGNVTVNVTDGALTISSGSGAVNNKLCFIEITDAAIDPEPEPEPEPDPTPAPTSAPKAPSGFDASAISATEARLRWNDNSDNEAGFKIERKLGDNGTYQQIAIVAAIENSFLDIGLSPGSRYVYRVRAYNALGHSTYSNYDGTWTQSLPGSAITWSTRASSPIIRAEALKAVVDGKLYVFGGFSGGAGPVAQSDLYDPASNTWTRLPDLPRRITHAGVAVDGRSIYIAGGYIGTGTGYTQQFGSKEVWKFNVDTKLWSRMLDLPKAVASGGLAVVGAELHYFSGNDSNRQDISDHFVLSLKSENPVWAISTPLPSGRSHFGYVTLNGRIYGIGGQKGNDEGLATQSSVHVFDPATSAWTTLASLPKGISHIGSATFVVGNRIVVAGGETSHGGVIADVWSYDVATNTWSAMTSLLSPRFSGVADYINGAVYFTTGSSQTATWRGIIS